MGKHAQLVIGPAGSGKSTYCHTLATHCQNVQRSVHVVNLDPAAEDTKYEASLDIRDLISVDDAMEELSFGPNGGLVFCMEYLVNNMDWLEERVADYQDDYRVFDCPGQVELYSHLPIMSKVVDNLRKWGYNICVVYVLDSLFITESSKFISGVLMCLSAMVQLELPHINVLSKCDLQTDKRVLARFLDPDMTDLMAELDDETGGAYAGLNRALARLIEDYSMVSFVPLDITDDESVATVLAHVDNAIQYGEDLEPAEPKDLYADGDDGRGDNNGSLLGMFGGQIPEE